ncbi:MAG TPA: hypothetical protein VK638_42805, partial [Edaphobacter sp.]|nr:hypothetical protein [Edaphobacter sp.]
MHSGTRVHLEVYIAFDNQAKEPKPSIGAEQCSVIQFLLQFRRCAKKVAAIDRRPDFPEFGIMQSVFSPAARRQRLKGLDAEGRGGELKTGWTKPLYETSSYGFSI